MWTAREVLPQTKVVLQEKVAFKIWSPARDRHPTCRVCPAHPPAADGTEVRQSVQATARATPSGKAGASLATMPLVDATAHSDLAGVHILLRLGGELGVADVGAEVGRLSLILLAGNGAELGDTGTAHGVGHQVLPLVLVGYF